MRCFKIEIPEPCTVGWENMQGESTTRFCGLCSKNVYNLSDMTEEEVADLIEVRGAKICVSIRRRADGTLYTDNCPRRLRVVRDFLRARLPMALVILAWIFQQSVADAQGLVGVGIQGNIGHDGVIHSPDEGRFPIPDPIKAQQTVGEKRRLLGKQIDPRFGSVNEIGGGLGAFECYQTAKDVSLYTTLLTCVLASLVAFGRLQKARLLAANAAALKGICIRDVRVGWTVVAKWMAIVVVTTLSIHVAGVFVVDRLDGYPIGWAGE